MSAFQRFSGSNVDCAAAMDPTASSATTHTKRLIFMVPPPQRPRSGTRENIARARTPTGRGRTPGRLFRKVTYIEKRRVAREFTQGANVIGGRRTLPAFSEGCGF